MDDVACTRGSTCVQANAMISHSRECDCLELADAQSSTRDSIQSTSRTTYGQTCKLSMHRSACIVTCSSALAGLARPGVAASAVVLAAPAVGRRIQADI